MARPKLQIDPKQVELLAGVGCTIAEIAATLGCGKRTLETRFCAAIKTGRERGKQSLRRKQFERAMKGSDTMLIWLGKQMLGQKDRLETEHMGEDGGPVRIRVEYADLDPSEATRGPTEDHS